MLLRFILLVILLPLSFIAQTQDSLLQIIQKEKDPAKKAETYLKLVTKSAYSDSLKAKYYLQQAEKLTSEDYKIGQAEIQNSWGYYYMPTNPERGKKHHLKGIEILKGENSAEAQNLRAKLWVNVAADEQRMGNIKRAMEVLINKSIPEGRKANDKIFLANSYLTVGLILYNDNNLDKAINYINSAVKTLQQMKPTPQSKSLFFNSQVYLTEAYLKMENYPTAKKLLDDLFAELEINPEHESSADVFHLASIYHFNTGNSADALSYAEEGLEYAEKSGNLYQKVRLTFMKSKAQSGVGKFDEAETTLKDLLKDTVYVATYGRNIATIYDELWMLEEKRGDYKAAFNYAKQRMAVSDSLHNADQNQAINEMETKFRTAENEKELALKQLEINRKNQYMWALILTTLVFLGAGIFTYLYFRNKRRLSTQREINLQQKLKEKEQAEELKVTKAILDGEERERERVAKDLHDGLGGMLAGVKINLSTWSSNNLEETQYEGFHRILNQLDSSVSELRRVARNLMPESLMNFGLEIALKDLCEFYMKDGLQIDFQPLNIQKNLPLNFQVNIYRIVQELLSNAVKHSDANSILVQCSQSENEFYITVEDNGKGIRDEEMSKLKSLGLKNLQNRVDFMKGKMEIQTGINQGTAVNIEVNTHVA